MSNLHLSGNQIVETIARLGARTTMNNSYDIKVSSQMCSKQQCFSVAGV